MEGGGTTTMKVSGATSPQAPSRRSNGLSVATTPIAGGLAVVTRDLDPREHRAARRLAPGHPELLTVAASIQDGAFVVGQLADDRSGPVIEAAYTGIEFAAALSGLPLYGRNLRLWLDRPADPPDQRRLDAHLTDLAEACGATVWAPQTGMHAALLEGCLDLAIRSPDGGPGLWREYRPPGVGPSGFMSDEDGRLVPVGAPRVRQVGGVALIAVPAQRDPVEVDRYHAVWSRTGLRNVDFVALDDGRLAVPYGDDSLLAVGPRELESLLRDGGWHDEDVCLLSPLTATQAAGAEEHLHALAGALRVDIYFRTPGSSLSIQDGHPRAVWPDGHGAGWHRMAPPGHAHEPPRWSSDDGWLEPAAGAGSPVFVQAGPMPHSGVGPSSRAVPTSGAPRRNARAEPDQPMVVIGVEAALRRSGLDWLPERPPVNTTALRLFVPSVTPPGRAGSEGVPSSELFLLGILDAATDVTRVAGMLLVVAEPGTAVPAAQVREEAPARLRERLAAPHTYVLPAGWLDRVWMPSGLPAGGESIDGDDGDTLTVDADGAPWRDRSVRPVVLRCAGAAHGIDGVPDDVVAWPRSRRDRAYAQHPSVGVTDEFVPLHRHRPRPVDGYRLLELRIPRDAAIDVPASAARVADLPLVRSHLGDLVRDAVDLLLPRRSIDQVTVTRAFLAEAGAWHAVAVPDLAPAELLVAQTLLVA